MNLNRYIFIILAFFAFQQIFAQSNTKEDSIYLARSMRAVDSVLQNRNIINRIWNYYEKASQDSGEKFSTTFGVAPYYKSGNSVGIGGIVTGLYTVDSLSRRSDISGIGKVTIIGYYSLELAGNHNCLRDIIRMEYDMSFSSFPQYYWGRGFENGDNNDTRCEMTRKSFHALVKPGFRIAKNLYAGPLVSYDWIMGKNFDSDSILGGDSKRSSTLDIGAFITYDSRDVASNPYKGIYFSAQQRNYINFGNNPFFKTIGDFRNYTSLWKDAVLATRLYGEFSYGEVPWTMTARGDGSTLMRSYYEGRYEDDNLLSITLELRQRIYKRFGAAAWVGAGNFFSDREPFSWNHTLSDLGIGLRWEFRKRMNVRIDCGFGRCGQWSLLFGIREAF